MIDEEAIDMSELPIEEIEALLYNHKVIAELRAQLEKALDELDDRY